MRGLGNELWRHVYERVAGGMHVPEQQHELSSGELRFWDRVRCCVL